MDKTYDMFKGSLGFKGYNKLAVSNEFKGSTERNKLRGGFKVPLPHRLAMPNGQLNWTRFAIHPWLWLTGGLHMGHDAVDYSARKKS